MPPEGSRATKIDIFKDIATTSHRPPPLHNRFVHQIGISVDKHVFHSHFVHQIGISVDKHTSNNDLVHQIDISVDKHPSNNDLVHKIGISVDKYKILKINNLT